jgi:ferritin-like metal-binding protein YciE
LKQKFDDHTRATEEHIDRFQVMVAEGDITNAQKKSKRQASIGTLGRKAS